LTSNGKVDRRALARPSPTTDPSESAEPPQTDTQATIHRIWCELLGRSSIGIHQNFFQLGGHSLLATQAIARMEAAFETELSMTAIFDAPTIGGFAKEVERAMASCSVRTRIHRSLNVQDAQALLSRIDELSDAEVEQLLGEESHNALSS